MKYRSAIVLLALVSTFIFQHHLWAFEQSARDYEDVLGSATAIAVAEVVSEGKKETRCSVTKFYQLKTLYSIKGPIETGRILPFSYTVYNWKKAFWPWQEDCHSVSYRLPPVANDMKKGARVIITLEYQPPLETDAMTSTRDITELGEVKRLLGIT